LILRYGAYDAGLQALATNLTPMLEQAPQGVIDLPEGADVGELAMSIARLMPTLTAGTILLVLCLNLYLAARSTALSHRLPRTWPDLPTELVLPRPLAVVAVVAIGAAIALPESTDQFAWAFAAPLFAIYAMQGLAVLHALSRGLPLRPLLLVVLYGCCAVRAEWTLPLIALVGLVDAAANLRARAAAARRSKV